MKRGFVFMTAGLTTGLVTAALGPSWPTMLAVGVGPLFFVALLAAIAMTGSWSHLHRGMWRYAAAALLSTGGYVLALFTFSVVAGYAPELLGVGASGDIVEFRGDVWLGLVAAVIVAAVCVEMIAFTLTSKWSNSSLASFAIAGFAVVVVTFVANRQRHHYWSFIGVLLPLGQALFCGLLGAQIGSRTEQVQRA